ncbi:MAG: thiamine phosphate synthase, partial [Oscillospiraceae bacterium]|nr:thiamine phosphate synthase [Oscillospiraceae bacterium]
MSEILCVTSRALCRGPFPDRIEAIAAARPAGILLREKDLSEGEYRRLAGRVLEVCRRAGTPCILHSFVDVAAALNAPALHVPLPVLRGMSAGEKGRFQACR